MTQTTEQKYGIRKSQVSVPHIDMGPFPHRDGSITLARFGPGTYSNNLSKTKGPYSHNSDLGDFPQVSFREPTTSESISVAGYKFGELAKPQIFDSRWLQAGRIVRTSEGFFANPPRDGQGNAVLDEQELKSYLNGTEPTRVNNGKIYVVSNTDRLRDFAFAEYGSFETGAQDSDTFAKGGLARTLEHITKSKAPNLSKISSKDHHKAGINVWGFGSVSEPVERVVSLGSDVGGRLRVGGGYSDGGLGFVFGVLNSGGASAKNLE